MHIPPSGTNQYVKHAWVAHIDNQCVGHIHLFVEPENKIKFLDAWVHSEYRKKGIFRKMWDIRWNFVQQHYIGYTAYAWCKPTSLPLLIENGFKKGDNCVYVEKIIKDKIPLYEKCFVSC